MLLSLTCTITRSLLASLTGIPRQPARSHASPHNTQRLDHPCCQIHWTAKQSSMCALWLVVHATVFQGGVICPPWAPPPAQHFALAHPHPPLQHFPHATPWRHEPRRTTKHPRRPSLCVHAGRNGWRCGMPHALAIPDDSRAISSNTTTPMIARCSNVQWMPQWARMGAKGVNPCALLRGWGPHPEPHGCSYGLRDDIGVTGVCVPGGR